MQRVNEYRFYELGQAIKAISSIRHDGTYENHWFALWQAREALNNLLIDAVAMRFSRPVVNRVITAITEIVPEDFGAAASKGRVEEGKPKPTVGIGYWELTTALGAFEPILQAECTALDTYVVSQKRGYVTSDLV